MRPSLPSVAIGLALALSAIAVILPQIQRSSAPEFIHETFFVGERVYELRVVPRPQTRDYSADAYLAEAIGRLFDHIAASYEYALRTDRLALYRLPGPPLRFLGPDGFPYAVSVTRFEGEPLMWSDQEGMRLLFRALREIFPEGYEHVWEEGGQG